MCQMMLMDCVLVHIQSGFSTSGKLGSVCVCGFFSSVCVRGCGRCVSRISVE